ncbi:MAG: DUF285 domain-containing protein [Clostridiales bacterium]|nr:DUF285 domain-containing protein [Clostridiales bacterium]
MKRLTILILSAIFIVSLAACGGSAADMTTTSDIGTDNEDGSSAGDESAAVVNTYKKTETGVKPSGNVLLCEDYESIINSEMNTSILGSDIPAYQIMHVTFLDSLDDMPEMSVDAFDATENPDGCVNLWDVSENQDGSVMAWTYLTTDFQDFFEWYCNENPQEEVTFEEKYTKWYGMYLDLYIAGDGGVDANPNSCALFYSYSPSTINFNDCFYTGDVTDMSFMFTGCELLTELDLSGFDTSNVTTMRSMFYGDYTLKSLDVSSFNTSNVTGTGMMTMFSGCSSLEQLDVSGFDTSQITYMYYMFYDCSSLQSLDVSGFDTSQVIDMDHMFANCSSLEELDISGFDMSNAMNSGTMLEGTKWE